MQNFDKYWPYFRYYGEKTNRDEFSWWYCLTDGEVYGTFELYEKFGYFSRNQILESGIFVEFYKIDVVKLQEEYLRLKLGKKGNWSLITEEDFSIEFNKYIDTNHLISSWYEFQKSVLLSVLKEWSSANGIVLK